MKYLFATILIYTCSNFCLGQSLDIKVKDALKQAKFIDLYRISRNSKDCEDSKDPMIFAENKIDPCFYKVKKLSLEALNTLTTILLNEHSYHEPYSNCFTTDFGLIIYNERHKMISYATLSLQCNNLVFNSDTPLTLTDKAKKKLGKIIH